MSRWTHINTFFKEQLVLCLKYVGYLYVVNTIESSTLYAVNGANLYLSSTIICRNGLYVHNIYSLAGSHFYPCWSANQ